MTKFGKIFVIIGLKNIHEQPKNGQNRPKMVKISKMEP